MFDTSRILTYSANATACQHPRQLSLLIQGLHDALQQAMTEVTRHPTLSQDARLRQQKLRQPAAGMLVVMRVSIHCISQGSTDLHNSLCPASNCCQRPDTRELPVGHAICLCTHAGPSLGGSPKAPALIEYRPCTDLSAPAHSCCATGGALLCQNHCPQTQPAQALPG